MLSGWEGDRSLFTGLAVSGVPRILEWEGSRRRRNGRGEGLSPSPFMEGSGAPSPENFSYFLLKIRYFDAF